MQENYLAKWLNGELTESELADFKASEEYATYQKIINASGKMEAPHFDVDRAWNTFNERDANNDSTTKVVPLQPYKQFLRIAAVIAVLLTGSYFYINSLDKTFTTAIAERTEITLPDNSQVSLNADSKVSYNAKKWDSKRALELEGEAFFKVAKGKKFTVTTAAGEVAVLGTQFNVEHRPNFFEVTCYEGLVRVTHAGQEYQLPAGNSFVVVNGKLVTTDKPTALEPSWMHNESEFKSIPLRYVLNELERQYAITVSTKNIDTAQLFTGTFSNTNLKLALESISTPSQIEYKLSEDNVLFYAGNTP